MTEENIRLVLSTTAGKLPEDKIMLFRNRLMVVPDARVDEIICTPLYDPTHILLFSIFLGGFGVDRFLIDDVGLGVAKLLLGSLTCGIWPLIDIFMSYKAAKEKNFSKLMSRF